LTRDEYDNTLRDLLRDSSRPARAFLEDEKAGPFDANGALPVTDAMLEKYQAAAEAVAATAARSLSTLVPCAAGAALATQDACAETFVRDFGRRAYRRPLGADELTRYQALYRATKASDGFAEGLRLVIVAALQSPHFLYRVELGAPVERGAKVARLTSHELAARLSYFLWDTLPDAALMKAADSDALTTPEQVEREARRLLTAPQAAAGLSGFLVQLLEVDDLGDAQKDAKLFPGFTPEVRASLRVETARFADAVLREGDARFDTLLRSRTTFLRPSLMSLYGARDPGGAVEADGSKKVELDAGQRSGFLTQAGLMASLAHVDQTSPVHRGLFVRESLLCHTLPSPPDNANVVPPKFDPQQSTRQRFVAHRVDPACGGCHALIDPVGFGFERYDAAGKFRSTEANAPVDASGEILGGATDVEGRFDGALELAGKLAGSRTAQRCFTRQWMRYALGRLDAAEDTCSVEGAFAAFAGGTRDVRELIVAVTRSDSFRHKRVLP
jgi:hypothetical protein